MGSKFIRRFEKRNLLFFLLLLFKGRAKYVTISLLMVAASLPFMASTETIERMLELPPVASFLKSVGLGGVISAINPGYSTAGFKAALDKATADSSRDSFWNKFLSSINSTLPPADGPSSMAMIRGGGDISGPRVLKNEKYAGPVKGVVNAEERAGGAVNLEGMLSNAAGDGGVYGDLMGMNLGDSSYGAPFVNRTLVSKGGAGSQSDGMYNHALSQAGNRIPVPGRPQKVNGKRMGKVSGFSWKNVGYRTKNAKVDTLNRKTAPLFQLAATFSMTDSVYKSPKSAPEYQASYVGATYDGNNVNADVITDAAPPAVPDTGFTGDTYRGQQIARECTDAQAVYGTRMSDDAAEMDNRSKMAQPKCYGNIGPWNANVNRMAWLCNDFNASDDALSAACQSHNPDRMQCEKFTNNTEHGGMIIKKCKKPAGKWKIFMMLLAIVLLVIAVLFFLVSPWAALLLALIVYAAYSIFGGGGGGGGGGGPGVQDKSLSDEDSKPGYDSKK